MSLSGEPRDNFLALAYAMDEEMPAPADAPEIAEERPPHPLARFRAPPSEVPQEPGFVLNSILCDKVSFIGAYAGAGKTTAIAPLALITAGLIDVPGINIYAWRRVVYISEHPEQLELILIALIAHYHLDPSEVWDRIRVVEAVKMSAVEVARVSPDYRALSVQHTAGDTTVDFLPWTIIDTQSATFRVDDENDNAEMGGIVAVLKQQMDLPVSVVAHTAKVHKRGDPELMSIRGGGALEGDANQVLYVSICPETDRRYIEIRCAKHRFVPAWDALELEYHVAQLPMRDPFGRVEDRPAGYCTVKPVRDTDRQEDRQQARQDRERAVIADAREAVLAHIIQCHEAAQANPSDPDHFPTQNTLEDALGSPRKAIRDAVRELKTEGRIALANLPTGIKRPGPKAYLIPADQRYRDAAQFPEKAPE